VLYYADSVFADQTERTQQYVSLYVSDREPRVRIIIIHIIVCFFLGFLFFMHQISTARGMNVSDNEREMRVTRVIREMSIVGNM
jgi:hypothetical protein